MSHESKQHENPMQDQALAELLRENQLVLKAWEVTFLRSY